MTHYYILIITPKKYCEFSIILKIKAYMPTFLQDIKLEKVQKTLLQVLNLV